MDPLNRIAETTELDDAHEAYCLAMCDYLDKQTPETTAALEAAERNLAAVRDAEEIPF